MYKTFGAILAFMIILVIALPALTIRGCSWQREMEENDLVKGPDIKVYFHESGQTESIPLEEYLVGVVAAEMPALFEPEALKAQAVAARTYALKRLGQENQFHQGADICTSHIHAQAWISKAQMQKKWGKLSFEANFAKIQRAVQETAGLVVVYDGKLIDPVYHATCGSKGTENSEEVWKYPVPYLKGVNCFEGQNIKAAKGEIIVSLKQLDKIFGTDVSSRAVLTKQGSKPFEVLAKTPRGRVKKIRVGEKVFTGGQFRASLGLRSTDFNWKIDGDKVQFTTNGNGHAVGMCQYGANHLAKDKNDFKKILTYYYKQVRIVQYSEGI